MADESAERKDTAMTTTKTTAAKTTTKKETAMTTKTAARKTTTKKETAMTETETKLKGQDAIAALIAERAAFVKKCRRTHAKAELIAEPVNFITGRPLNKDAKVIDDLRYIAAANGWTDNRFATAGQIKANGGKLAEDAKSDVMFFKMGEKYRYYRIYNYADIEWPDGIPSEFRKSAKRQTKKAAAKNTKDAAEIDALKELVAQLAAQNAAILAKLSA